VISDSAGKMAETVMEKLFEPEEQGQDKIKNRWSGFVYDKTDHH